MEAAMPMMEISVVALGTKTTSLSRFVAAAEVVLAGEKGIKSHLTAMGTIVEADSLDRLFMIAKKMHRSLFRAGAKRVLTTVKIDDRLDKRVSIAGKVASVERALRRSRRLRK
jgi:uncharacterized protein (TIGR00106 family)